MSLRGRLEALRRTAERRGLADGERCAVCGGGSDLDHSAPRLHLGTDPPDTCDACGGAIDARGRGFAKTWRWIRFVDQPE